MRLELAAAVLAGLVVAAGCGAGRAGSGTASRACAPPRGPGDRAVHSRDLHVTNIGCALGRKVALACVRFTYGHAGSCRAEGRVWRCTSTRPPGSESVQRCAAGERRMTIRWLD